MTGLFIFVGVALVLSVGAVALSARYRRFDPVVTYDHSSVFPTAQRTMLATSEEVTREELSAQRYDAEDDLLDPHHPRATPPGDGADAS